MIKGTVNGGGPERQMHTFNGNVYVRTGSELAVEMLRWVLVSWGRRSR